jgi:Fe2+ or Zn2+ uptake regulation protein
MSGIQKRATQQLATVYKALQGDHSHPSADEIYQRVRQTLPRISLGTVYRNLQRLVEERKIRMLLLGERVARYDPLLAAHDHFICQQCGRVEDLLLEQGHQVNLQPLIERGFTVLTHSLAIHGLCFNSVGKCRGGRVGQNGHKAAACPRQGPLSCGKGGRAWDMKREAFRLRRDRRAMEW